PVTLTHAGYHTLYPASRKGNTIDLHDTKIPLVNIYCIKLGFWDVRRLYDVLILSHRFPICRKKNKYKHRKTSRSRYNHSPTGCVGVSAVNVMNNNEDIKMHLEYLNMHVQVS
ncbi:unnamed protein product, partial [Ectocarpus sp. 12 AP-2014]